MTNNYNSQPNDLDEKLRQLVIETCGYPKGSLERQQGLTKIIVMMQKSGKLWRESGSVDLYQYEEALQKSWLYLCRNLCEAVTAKGPYNPDKARVTTWFNEYLKYRIKDIQKEFYSSNREMKHPQVDRDTGELIDPLENLPAPPENTLSMIEEIQQWLESNQQQLRRIHVRDRPDINCYVLISRYALVNTTWKTLAQEFGISIPTLSSFYQRQCLPLMKAWSESQGYLDD